MEKSMKQNRTTKKLGIRIRNLRASKGYGQKEMAEKLGLTPGAYAKIERGETDPSASRLLSIAIILGVDVADLMNEPGNVSTGTDGAVTRAEIQVLYYHINMLNSELENLKAEVSELKKVIGKKK